MKAQPLDICIADDVKAYFNEQMLELAKAAGYRGIRRLYHIDKTVLNELLDNPPDIIILDIKDVVDPEIAKDGFDIARLLRKNTNVFIVITSAHKYKMRNIQLYCDYILEDRLLTPVDFIDELETIISTLLNRKMRFYKKTIFRLGFKLAKLHLGAN